MLFWSGASGSWEPQGSAAMWLSPSCDLQPGYEREPFIWAVSISRRFACTEKTRQILFALVSLTKTGPMCPWRVYAADLFRSASQNNSFVSAVNDPKNVVCMTQVSSFLNISQSGRKSFKFWDLHTLTEWSTLPVDNVPCALAATHLHYSLYRHELCVRHGLNSVQNCFLTIKSSSILTLIIMYLSV